jgi:TonB family protein
MRRLFPASVLLGIALAIALVPVPAGAQTAPERTQGEAAAPEEDPQGEDPQAEAPQAENAAGDDGSPAPKLTPPKLEKFVEASYPESAREQDLEAEVQLELTLDAQGQVTKVQVVRPAGHGFDEAAKKAARQFEFEPATRNGQPIPAVIRYEYVFELEDARSAEQPSGRLQGRVLGLEDGEPIGGAEVRIEAPDRGLTRQGVTGEQGRFRFEQLPPGAYRVTVDAAELGTRTQTERVQAGQVTEVTYRLQMYAAPEDEGDEPVFGAVAVAEPPPREVVRRTIEKEQLTRIPGTRGDALRTVELLPGVGRPPFGAGQLLVRGSSPNDSAVFFEGVSIPLLYHFGGLTSFINSRLLEQIDFYPGNFSARYGRRTGGILEVSARDPATDGVHGVAKVDVIDASLLVETPIGDDASVAFALRRSYIDAVFEAFAPGGSLDIVAAPVYWDYQAFATWRPTEKDRVRAMVYGSSDRFEAVLDEAADSDPAVRGDLNLNTQFHFAHFAWKRRISDAVRQELIFQVGPSLTTLGLGDTFNFDLNTAQIYGRAEWKARLNPAVQLVAGMDILALPFELEFRGPPPRQGEGTGSAGTPLATSETLEQTVSGVGYRPATYVESHLDPVDWMRVVMGLRLDYFRQIEEWAFDPRVVTLFDVTDKTRLKFGAGIFSQPPEFQESAPEVGNPNLEPIRALHLNIGAERKWIPGVQTGVEVFYKRLWDRVVETPGGVPPGFITQGVGRIYGVEVSGVFKPEAIPFVGRLSYTLSRSERKDGPDQRWRLFDFDQTHIFSATGLYKLGRGWQVGATVRLVSGNPRTPVASSVYNANNDVYLPIDGRLNSERSPMFNRLDVRVEKQWDFDSWKLALYLDVQNVYNADNPEGRVYNFDFTESAPLRGLPIIPSLGMRGEM